MYKSNETSREKGMLRNWDLQELYIKKLGFCSYCSIKKSNIAIYNDTKKCFICSWSFKLNHTRQCKAINSNCLNCVTASHFAKACSQEKSTIDIKDKIIDGAKSNLSHSENETHQFFKLPHSFKNNLFIIYAGPKNLVCWITQAKLRGILNKSTLSATIIYPYNLIPIKVGRTILFCSVTFYGHRILSTRQR